MESPFGIGVLGSVSYGFIPRAFFAMYAVKMSTFIGEKEEVSVAVLP